jgi:hypothetical protein
VRGGTGLGQCADQQARNDEGAFHGNPPCPHSSRDAPLGFITHCLISDAEIPSSSSPAKAGDPVTKEDSIHRMR